MPVSYLSDSDRDHHLLEQYIGSGELGRVEKGFVEFEQDSELWRTITEKVKADNPDLMSSTNSEELEALDRRRNVGVLPTRFDSWASYWIVSKLVADVKVACQEVGLDASSFPPFATLPTKSVNALAVRPPGSSVSFLLFDGELLTFCHLISKIYAQAFPLGNGNGNGWSSFACDNVSVANHVRRSPILVRRLSVILDAFIKTGYVGCTPPFPVDMASAALAQCLRRSMELFVVAHEFGHVYAGHLGPILPSLNVVTAARSISREHQMEFEADHVGLVLALTVQRAAGLDVALSVAGIRLFFLVLDLADAYELGIRFGGKRKFVSVPSDSHPSNEQRWAMIESALSVIGVSEGEIKSAEDLSSQLGATTDTLLTAMLSARSKPGRNDPCSCGSNAKYKKCCMQ